MTQTPQRVVDELVRIACEAIDRLEHEHDQMTINCTMLISDLNDRFEECLAELDANSVDGGYIKCFAKHGVSQHIADKLRQHDPAL